MYGVSVPPGTPLIADDGVYSPAIITVAELPDDGTCFDMMSVDLNKVCGESSCVLRSTVSGNPVSVTIILQREEVCGDGIWTGVGGAGALDPSACPA